MTLNKIFALFCILFCFACGTEGQESSTSLGETMRTETGKMVDENALILQKRFKPPNGFKRVRADSLSFANYLRNLPLYSANRGVFLYDGKLKYNQNVHAAVINIDVGKRDLQQCADAVMRLRAEYLFATDRKNEIAFDFTNGFNVAYEKWRDGHRIRVNGNKVKWVKSGDYDESYAQFRKYLDLIYAYAGTLSLDNELHPKSIDDMAIGDVFIEGGSPGHAIIVVDMVVNEQNGEKRFLLAQSYMPAQDIHILKNHRNPDLSPWYSLNVDNGLVHTPEWIFSVDDLKSFEK